MFKVIAAFILRRFAFCMGVIMKQLLKAAGTALVVELMDEVNQKKAYELVKELNTNKDLTTLQKAKEFNKRLIAWAKNELGKTIPTSVVNCLRELAVNAVKSESEASSQA